MEPGLMEVLLLRALRQWKFTSNRLMYVKATSGSGLHPHQQPWGIIGNWHFPAVEKSTNKKGEVGK